MSDASKIRVEGLLLFDERQSAQQTGIAAGTTSEANSGGACSLRAAAAATPASVVKPSKVDETPPCSVGSVGYGVGGSARSDTNDASVVDTNSNDGPVPIAADSAVRRVDDSSRETRNDGVASESPRRRHYLSFSCLLPAGLIAFVAWGLLLMGRAMPLGREEVRKREQIQDL